jgi:peroxiredoxin
MYLRFDSRPGPANDVKLAAMSDRPPTIRHRLPAALGVAIVIAAAAMSAGALALGLVGQPSLIGQSSLIGRTAPDFALPAAVGSNVRLSEYRGQPVILSFWSSRCGPCVAQLATLDRLYRGYAAAGLIVLGVSVDDDPMHAEQFARAHNGGFPLLLDEAKTVSRAYEINRLPSTILIDRSGIVRYSHGDDRPDDGSYLAQIRALLDDAVAVP